MQQHDDQTIDRLEADIRAAAALPPSGGWGRVPLLPLVPVTQGDPLGAGAPAVEARAPAGYRIEREVGRGGMGVVYLAFSLALGRPCALKMILSGAHGGSDELTRFRTEAQAIARLQHPGIVQVFEVGEHDGVPFMSLEFCGGGSLDAVLAKNPLGPREAAGLVRKLAEAVQAAHEAKVVHRDLKPANVLLTDRGEPKVTDFGLAKKLDEDGATRTGSVMGTPSYMPPEQALGQKGVGPAADVYALGAVLYECLVGRPPFKAATAIDTLMQVVTEEPAPVRRLNPQAPADLETIAHKCLQKSPARRYRSARELADDLGRYLAGRPILARPVGPAERAVKWVRRNRAVSALAAGLLLALTAGLAGSGWFALDARSEARRADGEARQARGAEADALRAKAEAERRETSEAGARALAQREAARAEAEKAQAEANLGKAERLVYLVKVSAAQRALEDKDGKAAVRHLEECQWDLRGWEYRHLWSRVSARQTFRAGAEVHGVAFSPDGRRVLAGVGNTARAWDAGTGAELLTLRGHTFQVDAVAFSPDGRRILTGGFDNTARIWDAGTGAELLALRGHTYHLHSVAFSPDGTRALTAAHDGTVRLWDARTAPMRAFRPHRSCVHCGAFSPDGRRVLTGSATGAIFYDADTGAESLAFRSGEPLVIPNPTSIVKVVAYSPDGRLALIGGLENTALLWDVRRGVELLTLKGHAGAVNAVAFSPDGGRLLTGSADGTARVWDADTGAELLALQGHTGAVTGVAFSPDGRRVLTGSVDGTVRLWDSRKGNDLPDLLCPSAVASLAVSPDGKRVAVASGKKAQIWDAETGVAVLTLGDAGAVSPGAVNAVAFSPDGRLVLTGEAGKDGLARLWDAKKGTMLLELKGHTGSVSSVAFSPDGRRLLTGGDDKTARLWDAAEGTQLLELNGHAGRVSSVAFSPDGRRLLTGSWFSPVRLWDANNGALLLQLMGHTREVTGVAFSPDGRLVLTGSHDKTARLWDAEKGTQLLELKSHTEVVRCVAFSPDGGRLVSGSQDGTVRLWDARIGVELLTLRGHTQGVTAVAFSPDGRLLVSGGIDRTVRFWGGAAEGAARHLRGHEGAVTCVAFSPDGRRVLTGGSDRTVRLWDARKGAELLTLRGHTNPVSAVAFSPDGRRAFAWDSRYRLAWAVADGKPATSDDPPEVPKAPFPRSPDGRLAATPDATGLLLRDAHRAPEEAWPQPDDRDRLRHHGDEADRGEAQGRPFAAAFHLGQVLRVNPLDRTALVRLAHAQAEAGRPDLAALHVTRAVLLAPQEPLDDPAAARKGEGAVAAGDWPRAARHFRAAARRPGAAEAEWTALLLAQLAAKDADGLQETAAQVTSDPRLAAALLSWLEAVPLGRAEADRLVALTGRRLAEERSALTLHRHGVALFRAGRHDEALRLLRGSMQAQGKGGHADTRLFLALVQARRGQRVEAARLLAGFETWQRAQRFEGWRPRVKWQVLLEEARRAVRGPGEAPAVGAGR